MNPRDDFPYPDDFPDFCDPNDEEED